MKGGTDFEERHNSLADRRQYSVYLVVARMRFLRGTEPLQDTIPCEFCTGKTRADGTTLNLSNIFLLPPRSTNLDRLQLPYWFSRSINATCKRRLRGEKLYLNDTTEFPLAKVVIILCDKNSRIRLFAKQAKRKNLFTI